MQTSDSLYRRLMECAHRLTPGEKLPSIRNLMKTHHVTQRSVERALERLIQDGMVRRDPGRGYFIPGIETKSRLVGYCRNEQASDISSGLFVDGLRGTLAESGFQMADFGGHAIEEVIDRLLRTMSEAGFAGMVLDLSTRAAVCLDGRAPLIERLRRADIPLVTTRPLPTIQADSVTCDDFEAFRFVGEELSREGKCIDFFGHLGLNTLSRLYGLEMGLSGRIHIDARVISGEHAGIFDLLANQHDADDDRIRVIAVPPSTPEDMTRLNAFLALKKRAKAVVILEEMQQIHPAKGDIVLRRPVREMGAAAARLLIRRLARRSAPPVHEVVPLCRMDTALTKA